MPFERLVGVHVTDEEKYQEYRRRMTPLLESHGGRFVVDVRVSEVLRAPEPITFNRMFTIRFPDEQTMNGFFANDEYLAIKEAYFVPSVSATVSLGRYSVP